MTATDYAALLARICATPADDAPRLVAADWLQERDEACQECEGVGRINYGLADGNCGKCDGFGSNGFADRAELIRVQVELAQAHKKVSEIKTESGREYVHPGWRELNNRSRELLSTHGERWAADELLRPCGFGDWTTGSWFNQPPIKGHWSRGFIGKIECDTATLLGGPCPQCVMPYASPNETDRSGCPLCSGTGHTPGIAAAVGRAVPVTEVVLSDRGPYTLTGLNGPYWHWYHAEQVSERPHPQSNVPAEIFTLIDLPQEYHYKYVDSAAAARAALATAAAEYCRRQTKESV
jgi:uncharacterized protein (TIGR02996 family)